ncbi:MAG: cation transporter [Desulfobacterales bacterium]|nr:MAG: cation transporter [Desulfobacterales bacterium]
MDKTVNPLENHLEHYDNVQQARQARHVTWIGLAANLILFVTKFTLGYLGASQAVIADAFHSLSDITTDIAILFGIKFWSSPPDECHPYGHKRIETIVTVIIGIALFIIALGIGYNALILMRKTHLKPPTKIAAFAALLSIILKEVVFHWTSAVGTRIKSSALLANAWHHRSDAISSIPVLIAVTIAIFNPNLAFIDLIGALIVSLFILKVSWDIMRPAVSELSDGGASAHDREKIKSIVLEVDRVKETHAIRTRKLGAGLYVDLHVLVDGEMTVQQGHRVAHEVKNNLLAKGPDILDVVVHIEPYTEYSMKYPGSIT